MFLLGAHVSIAGGISRAITRELEIGGNCGQIFVSSPRAWAVSAPPEDESAAFRKGRADASMGPFAVHTKYLVNLGTRNEATHGKSLTALQAEIDVASKLGIEHVVFHPGAHTGGMDRAEGMAAVSSGIASLEIPRGTKLLLENTSGRGTALGRTFGELSRMIEASGKGYEELGVCLDTCHAFCAGYPIHNKVGLESVIREFDDEVGLMNLCMVHLNDSKHPFDSRGDEHEHIGMGHLGEGAFRLIVNHYALAGVPMVLETPVTPERGYAENIALVRTLMER